MKKHWSPSGEGKYWHQGMPKHMTQSYDQALFKAEQNKKKDTALEL